jgi:hypothetical protein
VTLFSNGVEIDSEFWERGFVHSLGFKNRRSVDVFRLFKVQNMDKISGQNSESIFSPLLMMFKQKRYPPNL